MPEMTPSLQKLADLGLPVDSIPAEQLSVLSGLSDEESSVLVGILDRMMPEVEGQMMSGAVVATPNPALRRIDAASQSVRPGLTDGYVFW